MKGEYRIDWKSIVVILIILLLLVIIFSIAGFGPFVSK